MPKFRYSADQHDTMTFRVGTATIVTQRVCLTGLLCCNKKEEGFSYLSLSLSQSMPDVSRSEI